MHKRHMTYCCKDFMFRWLFPSFLKTFQATLAGRMVILWVHSRVNSVEDRELRDNWIEPYLSSGSPLEVKGGHPHSLHDVLLIIDQRLPEKQLTGWLPQLSKTDREPPKWSFSGKKLQRPHAREIILEFICVRIDDPLKTLQIIEHRNRKWTSGEWRDVGVINSKINTEKRSFSFLALAKLFCTECPKKCYFSVCELGKVWKIWTALQIQNLCWAPILTVINSKATGILKKKNGLSFKLQLWPHYPLIEFRFCFVQFWNFPCGSFSFSSKAVIW